MSTERVLSDPDPMINRRALLGTVARIATITAIFTAACRARLPEYPFPENQILGAEFIQKPQNIDRIIAISAGFPVWDVLLTREEIDIKRYSLSDLRRKLKINGTALGTYEDRKIVMGLFFEEGASLGPNYKESITPAFMVTDKRDAYPSTEAEAVAEGELLGDKLRYMKISFPKSIDELIGSELVFFLNHGILNQQPNSATFIPVRYRILPSQRVPT